LLNADGYNDKLAVLLEVVVKRMKELKVDKKRFDIIVDQVRFSFLIESVIDGNGTNVGEVTYR